MDGDAVELSEIERRFWSKVQRGGPDECWEWQGHRMRGYGYLKVDGRDVRAHRVAWTLVSRRGPIPECLVVMHSCDNPPCVNPAHLSLGTQAENNADRHAKGRTVMPTNGPDYQRIKTHCRQGHPYAGDNVRYRKSGARYCGECSRLRTAAYLAANRDQHNARRRANRSSRRNSA